MKRQMLVAALITLALVSCSHSTPLVTGCMNTTATNYNPNANSSCSSCCTFPQGGVLFYITNPAVLSNCGPVTVTLSNGQSTVIQGYYTGIPASCVNQVGGYLLVNTGTYTYTITSGGCGLANGTVTVIAGCNRVPI